MYVFIAIEIGGGANTPAVLSDLIGSAGLAHQRSRVKSTVLELGVYRFIHFIFCTGTTDFLFEDLMVQHIIRIRISMRMQIRGRRWPSG